MGRLFRLQVLNLNSNLFGGQIPASLLNCSNLRVLRLTNKKLIGNIPKDAFTQLVQLHMSSNNLLGSIPPCFGNLSTLKLFLAQKNLLEGSIWDSLGSLKSLTYVSLSANKLTSTIPPSIYNILSLTAFEAPNNLLEGSRPQNLGPTLPNIKRLNLWGNQLSGSIPLNLFTVGLGTGDANDLDFVSDLAKCSKLSVIELEENNFGGVLPNSLANFSTKLQYLTVAKNKIFENIPTDIGNLVSLNALDLHYNQLTGSIPNSIGKLDKLQQLGFGKNKLFGEIPSSIANLTLLTKLCIQREAIGLSSLSISLDFSGNYLTGSHPFGSWILNLSFNDLGGEIPIAGVFQNATAISVSGNNKLCGGIPTLQLPSCALKMARKLIIPIVCGVLGIIFALSILLLCWLRKMRKQSIVASCLMDSSMDMSYRKLFKETNGFSLDNLIGSRSFGSVYKRILHPNEKAITVKLLDLENRGASRSFITKCKTLGNIRHQNLVKIINACASVDFQAIDVASTLDYLHNHCYNTIIHSDIKPSNILLDSDMTTHVGDFGLARLLQQPNNELSKAKLALLVSIHGDVYSNGILLLELFTRKRPTDGMFIDGLNRHRLAKIALPKNVMEIIDQKLVSAVKEKETSKANSKTQMEREKFIKSVNLILRVGVECSKESPRDRITIVDAAKKLHLIKEMLLGRRISTNV
ncbi:putative receptor-like protein kinase At3g47110 [Camellia sinensis]|uniref:putative receptor-like protein kinase At3g47110 n=1 Tax=Camellia sinensis TaxID=4442 RepID=UPI00103668E4|nr:putative receptor-like protein kinase At3g47110 [Camellia sinensis]